MPTIRSIDLTDPEFTDLPEEGVRYASRILTKYGNPVTDSSKGCVEVVLLEVFPGRVPVPQSHGRPRVSQVPEFSPVVSFRAGDQLYQTPVITRAHLGEVGTEAYYLPRSEGAILYYWERGKMIAKNLADVEEGRLLLKWLGEKPHGIFSAVKPARVLAVFTPPYRHDPPETVFLPLLEKEIESDLKRRGLLG